MGFVFRIFMKNIFAFIGKHISSIISFIFAAFKGMPARVGLAIIGSILLIISFSGGLLWGFFSANFYNEDLRYAIEHSITPLLIIVLLWICIATFLPSLERQHTKTEEDGLEGAEGIEESDS
ncbi:MAG: hypothetical protein P8Q35_00345 [Candidatus Thalassarchaeaceae archaeon]|nr:hypothetical protein [Candidatus Thalassarchaeaceae archaeon]